MNAQFSGVRITLNVGHYRPSPGRGLCCVSGDITCSHGLGRGEAGGGHDNQRRRQQGRKTLLHLVIHLRRGGLGIGIAGVQARSLGDGDCHALIRSDIRV